MDTLKAMQVFVEVARQQGFAPAARHLGLSTSSVSRHVLNLERQLRCQLFVRTTRHLTLSQAGSELLNRCQRIVHDVEDLLHRTRQDAAVTTGRLRLTMPEFLSTWFARDVIARYVSAHPEVEVELHVLTRVVNLVEEDFDLAVRVGNLPDSTLIARKLLDLRLVLVGSPDYVARRGAPRAPADLRAHNCIVETESPYKDRWPLLHGGTRRRHWIKGNVRVSNGEVARELVIGGAGLALLPLYMVVDALRAGRLVAVMEDCMPDYGGVFAVYPPTRYLSRAVREFLSLLVEHTASIRAGG